MNTTDIPYAAYFFIGVTSIMMALATYTEAKYVKSDDTQSSLSSTMTSLLPSPPQSLTSINPMAIPVAEAKYAGGKKSKSKHYVRKSGNRRFPEPFPFKKKTSIKIRKP